METLKETECLKIEVEKISRADLEKSSSRALEKALGDLIASIQYVVDRNKLDHKVIDYYAGVRLAAHELRYERELAEKKNRKGTTQGRRVLRRKRSAARNA